MAQEASKNKLMELMARPNFKEEFIACARDDYAKMVLEPLPTAIHVGVATAETYELYTDTSFFDYPPGLMCLRCFKGQSNLVTLDDKLSGTLTKCCRCCARQRFPSYNVTLNPRWQPIHFVLPPLTSSPVNLIVPIMRYSREGSVNAKQSQKMLQFIETWKSFPHLNDHVQFIVGEFAGVGSGLALLSHMNRMVKCKKTDGAQEKPFSTNKIVPFVRSCFRMGLDKVTLVGSTMATFAVKPSNFVSLIKDFTDVGIPANDLNFVCYGQQSSDACTRRKPHCKTGSEVLQDIDSRDESICWLQNLRIECAARVFSNGLGAGRNVARVENVNENLVIIEDDSD